MMYQHCENRGKSLVAVSLKDFKFKSQPIGVLITLPNSVISIGDIHFKIHKQINK